MSKLYCPACGSSDIFRRELELKFHPVDELSGPVQPVSMMSALVAEQHELRLGFSQPYVCNACGENHDILDLRLSDADASGGRSIRRLRQDHGLDEKIDTLFEGVPSDHYIPDDDADIISDDEKGYKPVRLTDSPSP